jgi:hypothetical protein
MTARKLSVLAIVIVAIALGAAPVTAQHEHANEVKAEVPALGAFHEIIYPLWHTAWPNKDVNLMKELLPKVKEHVAALQKAELPGILRDKQAKWDEGVKKIVASAEAYEKALAADQLQPLLDAVEELHAGFERQVRLIRPPMKELEAYHQVLYTLFHHDWPKRQLEAVQKASEELVARCQTLEAAAIPKRVESKQAQLKEAFTALCQSTSALKTAAAGKAVDTIGAAVELVHTKYQAAEKLFE